jgi:Protein of unknown function (DUF4232)
VITKMRMTLIAVTAAVLLATAGGVAAAASQGITAAPSRTAAVTSTVPCCCTHNLTAGLHGFQAGLGNRGFILTLTNTGSTSCSLSGYPGLGLDNARHSALPSHTFRGSTYFDPDPERNLIVPAMTAYGTGRGIRTRAQKNQHQDLAPGHAREAAPRARPWRLDGTQNCT